MFPLPCQNGPALALAFGRAAQAEGPHKLVTILTAPEAQTQLMAMDLTMIAMAAGVEVETLLCGSADDISQYDRATAGQQFLGANPQGLTKIMMETNGLEVQVCAIYLPGKGAGASILLDGVIAAAQDALGAAIVVPATSVIGF